MEEVLIPMISFASRMFLQFREEVSVCPVNLNAEALVKIPPIFLKIPCHFLALSKGPPRQFTKINSNI